MSPGPSRYHQDISRNTSFLLLQFLQDKPIGKLYVAPFGVYLTAHDVFQPDIVFVANDRLSILTDEGATGAPTSVVEILSPGTSLLDRVAKKKVYVSAGVEELWIIDPEARTVEVFRLQENPEKPAGIFSDSAILKSFCLPGLRIDSRKIFQQ